MELDSRLHLVLAKPIRVVEDADDRFRDLEVLVHRDEVVQRRRYLGHDRRAAADPDLESSLAALHLRDEPHVVDARDGAVARAAGERRLELPRQGLRVRMPHEVPRIRGGVRRDVEELVGTHTGQRASRDVADRVPARFARRQPDLAEDAHNVRRVLQLHVVELDVLARGHVPLVQRDEPRRYLAQRVQLVGRQPSERYLDAHHLRVGLALAVYALLQAVRQELRLVELTGLEPSYLEFEVVDLLRHHVDDASGPLLEFGGRHGLCSSR